MKKLQILLVTAACASALGACAGRIGDTPYEPAVMTERAPGIAWLNDAVVDRAWAGGRAMRDRLRTLVQRGKSPAAYPMAKAQCWVDVGFHETTRNDRSAFANAALGEAGRLVDALEKSQTPPVDTPLVAGSAKLRDDLWNRIGRVKSGAGFSCAQEQIACAEVELVHAGHEYNDGGWRYANSYVKIAEDRLGRAEQAAAGCPAPAAAPVVVPVPAAKPAAPPAVVAPPPAPVPTPVAPPPRVERHVISTDGLFAFDRGDPGGMEKSKAKSLDDIAAKLKGAKAVENVRVIGHTDPLGSSEYNLRLSAQRAKTVRAYLVAAGVPAGVITSEGRGKTQLVATCEGTKTLAARIACLAPNRRVEVEVVARWQ